MPAVREYDDRMTYFMLLTQTQQPQFPKIWESP